MTKTLPAIVLSIRPAQDTPQSQAAVEVKIKLSTGEIQRVTLSPEVPILSQIVEGEHVLAVPVDHPQSGQQRFEIATNYGDVDSSTV